MQINRKCASFIIDIFFLSPFSAPFACSRCHTESVDKVEFAGTAFGIVRSIRCYAHLSATSIFNDRFCSKFYWSRASTEHPFALVFNAMKILKWHVTTRYTASACTNGRWGGRVMSLVLPLAACIVPNVRNVLFPFCKQKRHSHWLIGSLGINPLRPFLRCEASMRTV